VIRKSSVDQGRFTLEGSRPFDVLKPWAALKILGTEGYLILFDHAFKLTADMNQLIGASDNLEPLNDPQLFIHIYRFVPRNVRNHLRLLQESCKGSHKKPALMKKMHAINELLNHLNVELHRAIRAEDSTFVSRTSLDATRYAPQQIVVLRAVTVNPLTTREILEEVLRKQEKMGINLYDRQYRARMDRLLRSVR
jgi:glutamate decarboxylase